MGTIPAKFAQLIERELKSIFSKQADSVTTHDREVQEVGVTVTGVVGHAQLVALLKLAQGTETHLSTKRSGAGLRYYFMADNAK